MTDLAEHERLSRELADGPLRDEMYPPLAAQPSAGALAESQPATAPDGLLQSYRLQFTGSGSEYFRIWIVNLLLTVVTLGIYSAWAKVRKTRYFWQNTRLDGHVFDYHGKPAAILRGRIVALVLLAAYTLALDISRIGGLITIGLLCASGPWLFLKAQQFKFRNTSHRGLRFDFGGNVRDAYVRLLPLLLIWFSGTVAGVLFADKRWVVLTISLGTLVLLPWMHRRLKSYQHERARYGDQQARFMASTGVFYWVYAKGTFIVIGAFVLAVVVGALVGLATRSGGLDPQYQRSLGWIAGLFVVATVYLALWPYYAARLQRIVWDNTQLGPLRFRTTMAALPLLRLILACVFWTLLTLGLYWPFAAIRLARYRLQSMEVLSAQPFDQLARGVNPIATAAAGDGAVELFGLDVGL